MRTHKYDAKSELSYYEVENTLQPLVLIHAQGVDARSYDRVLKRLSRKFHVYAVDCYGHGESLHDPAGYNIQSIGHAIAGLIETTIRQKVWLLGHSSGGLLAAYIAAETDLCQRLFLEDPPFFASQGERRKSTYNYIDLSTVCHRFNAQTAQKDFVLYYFANQYAWNFFPEKSRDKLKQKMVKMAASYRQKHPDKDLKVPFWPKAALSGFQGMNHYDPLFGETFFNDSFHCGILHEDMLPKINCPTVLMKAKTNVSPDGLLMAALSEEDAARVVQLIPHCEMVRFDCGHGIHIEKEKQFASCLLDLA